MYVRLSVCVRWMTTIMMATSSTRLVVDGKPLTNTRELCACLSNNTTQKWFDKTQRTHNTASKQPQICRHPSIHSLAEQKNEHHLSGDTQLKQIDHDKNVGLLWYLNNLKNVKFSSCRGFTAFRTFRKISARNETCDIERAEYQVIQCLSISCTREWSTSICDRTSSK